MREEFSDVGLMTGDITISPNATVSVVVTLIFIISNCVVRCVNVVSNNDDRNLKKYAISWLRNYERGCMGNLRRSALYAR